MEARIRPYHEWEAKHKLLNNRKIGEFQYWNYMRRDMIMSFSDEYSGIEPPFYKNISKKTQTKADLIKNKAGDILFFLTKGLKTEKKNIDALFLCHRRRQKIDGRMVSIYSDFVEDRFRNVVTLERGDTKFNYECPRYSPNLVYSGRVELMSYIYRYLVKFFKGSEYRKIKEKVKGEMSEPFKDLEENYGLHVKIDDFAERVTTLYYFYKYRKPKYKKFLEELSPKVIVEVVGGGFDAKIINELALGMKIPTIELQHGTGAMDVVYPQKDTPVDIAPQWYFTFSEYWKELVKLPWSEDRVFAGGFPYHELVMKDYSKEKWKHDPKTVIFLSSRKYGKEMAELAIKLSELDKDLHIIFKLHPREFADWKENYGRLIGSRVDVIDNQNNGLYEYFAESSAQVGVDSTAIYEGFSFELDTYIWDIPKAKNLKELLCPEYAETVKNAEELYEKLMSRNGRPSYNADFFWKEDSVENIAAKIREIGKIEGKK